MSRLLHAEVEWCPLIMLSEMKERWTDIVMHVKWTKETDGFFEVWINVSGGAIWTTESLTQNDPFIFNLLPAFV